MFHMPFGDGLALYGTALAPFKRLRRPLYHSPMPLFLAAIGLIEITA